MKLEIVLMAYCGKAFLLDLEKDEYYYLHQAGDEIVPISKEHFYPMNLQGVFPVPPEDYERKQFSSFEEASDYIKEKYDEFWKKLMRDEKIL